MGFHNLHCFNMAMLAKQVWHLMHHTDSSLYQCLKAKYFPNENFFFEATEGSDPSFVWKSILQSQAMLRQGSRWRVGEVSLFRFGMTLG